MDNRFGTWLRPAMADIDDGRLKRYWTAVEELSKQLEHSDIRKLIRFSAQVGKIDEDTLSKVRNTFFENDNAFLMTGNDFELRLLSSVIVIKMLLDKTDQLDHALAVACLDCCGAHSCFELHSLVEEANRSLNTMSHELRPKTPLPNLGNEKINAKSVLKPLKAKAAKGTPQVEISDLEPILTAYAKSDNNLASNNEDLRTALELQKEEVDVLWWLVGAYSNDLERPYSELEKAITAVVAGKEFAELVLHRPGPIGATGILKRMLANGTGGSQKISLQELVPNLPMEWRERVSESVTEDSIQFCPLLAAISASVESKADDAWVSIFKNRFPRLLSTAILPEIFSFQMYREWMMVLEIKTWE